jgi:hypothetical protein
MGITAILGVVGMLQLDSGSLELSAAHQEVRGSLEQAFSLARARGSNVTVALGRAGAAAEHLPVQLGRKVKLGKPAHIPLPPGMEAPSVAAQTGEAHALMTVTPRHTALAGAWFLNNGRDALCMRLSGQGRLTVLRYRASQKKWTRA